MGGQDVKDILAALEVMTQIGNIKSVIETLLPLIPYRISERDWDKMSKVQQTTILETHPTVYIEEDSGEYTEGHRFEDGILILSPNCEFSDGILTISDYIFENGILTLNQ